MARGSVDLEATRRREFRRMLLVSGVVHVGVVVLAMAIPAPAAVQPAGVITVDLVAALPSAAPKPAKPAAAPEAVAPAPAPRPKPKPKQTVLPKKPTDRASKPKPATKKPAPRREVFLEPETKEEKSLEELMAEMRGESGEPTPEPVQTATTAPVGVPTGRPESPALRDWKRRVDIHVKRAWVMPPGFRMQDLQTEVVVDLDAAGNVRGAKVARRSGSPYYDDNVIRGISKASPLPAPPEAGDWRFIFTPEGSY